MKRRIKNFIARLILRWRIEYVGGMYWVAYKHPFREWCRLFGFCYFSRSQAERRMEEFKKTAGCLL